MSGPGALAGGQRGGWSVLPGAGTEMAANAAADQQTGQETAAEAGAGPGPDFPLAAGAETAQEAPARTGTGTPAAPGAGPAARPGRRAKPGRGRTGRNAKRSSAPPARLSLSNWPVARRLIALFAVASVTGLVFGGLRVADAVGTANGYARTTQLAILGRQVTLLAQNLENERDLTVGAAAVTALQADAVTAKAGPRVTASLQQALTAQEEQLADAQRATSAAAAQVQQLAQNVISDPAFPVSVQDKANDVAAQAGDLDALRVEVLGQSPALIIDDYEGTLSDLFALNADLTSASGDALLSDEVIALGALSQAKDQAAQQRAMLYAAFIESGLNDAGGAATKANPTGTPYNNVSGPAALDYAGGLQALSTAEYLQVTDLQTFQSSATPAESAAYLATVTGARVEAAETITNLATTVNGNPDAVFPQVSELPTGFRPTTAGAIWYTDQSAVVDTMRAVENQLATQIVQRSQLLQHQAFESALLTALVTAAAVLLVTLATALVGRSLVNPLRRLQADALEIATERLPARVAAAAASTEGAEGPAAVEPIGVQSTDEIGRVARAFDQVHAEAVRLAGTEAQLRGSLNAMFISLSRRSVPLIERLSRMIDAMEQSEDDPDQLANLFAMDHLVTRMRRNSENLLVLAGEEPVRKWTKSVPLTDVTRAAAAEIEQYGRVTLTVQRGMMISGQAAADVVHLLAELIENATLFSPQNTQVQVTVTELRTGGVLIEVRDDGVGITPSRLADMNWRLDHPPVLNVSISRHMGLYAVSRLAARHGIRVKLRPGTPQGLSALVWLPGTLARYEPLPGVGGSHSRPFATASSESAGSWQEVPARSEAPARRAVGRHRSGLFSSGEQPRLDGRGDSPARPPTAWFAAKRPSAGAAGPTAEPVAWQVTTGGWPAAGMHAAGHAGHADGLGGVREQADTTASGLPRRVPRTSAYPGSADTPDSGMPAARGSEMPVFSAPPAATDAAGDGPQARTGHQEQVIPRRRSPEAARSRLSGFQLGSRDAVQAGSGTGLAPHAGEENSR